VHPRGALVTKDMRTPKFGRFVSGRTTTYSYHAHPKGGLLAGGKNSREGQKMSCQKWAAEEVGMDPGGLCRGRLREEKRREEVQAGPVIENIPNVGRGGGKAKKTRKKGKKGSSMRFERLIQGDEKKKGHV